jgi:hypothetical protein
MRLSLLTLTAIATLFFAADASAQRYDPRYPVCMHVYSGGPRGGGSDWFDCSFTSLEQCRATASGLAASCDVNPYYSVPQSRPHNRRNG